MIGWFIVNFEISLKVRGIQLIFKFFILYMYIYFVLMFQVYIFCCVGIKICDLFGIKSICGLIDQ